MPDSIGWIDAAVMMAVMASAIAVGLWNSRSNCSAESFLFGDRNLPWWAILGSIVATETSAATVMSIPGTGFGPAGMKFLQLAIGLCVGKVLVVCFLLPLFFDHRLGSAYEVLRSRFGFRTRLAAALLFLIARNVGDGLRLFLAAIVMQELLGWSYIPCVITMGLVTIGYTLLGGMRSVVWNDCLQLLIYIAGGIAALFVIMQMLPNGWSEMWEQTGIAAKMQVFDFTFSLSDPWNFWAGLIGGTFLALGTHGTDQMMVQRYLSARSKSDAALALSLSGVVVAAQFALFLMVGVGLAGFYGGTGLVVDEPDKVFVLFVINHFPAGYGLVGMILAAILAATMSTLSSSLTASASSLMNDFWLPAMRRVPNEKNLLATSRWMTAGFGLLQIGIGIQALNWTETVINNALTIAGFVFGLLLGMFSIGTMTKLPERPALAGGATGLAVLLCLQFVLPRWDIQIAFVWLAMAGSVTTFLSALLFNLALPGKSQVVRAS